MRYLACPDPTKRMLAQEKEKAATCMEKCDQRYEAKEKK